MYGCNSFSNDGYGGKLLRKEFLILFILAILVASVSASFAADPINNATDLSSALNQAHADNKKVMVVFNKQDCKYCDMFKKDVLSNGNVVSEINKDYILVFVDINEHPDIASKYKIFGTPTTLFLNSDQKEIHRTEGYVDANEFLKELKAI